MNFDNQSKEEVSCVCVNLVAAVAGYEFQRAERLSDSDGVDGTIIALGTKGGRRRPRFDVQIKSTSKDILNINNEYISYPLKVKNYEELRDENVQAPQILILVLLPNDKNKVFQQSEEGININCSIYWISLRGYPPTTNEYTVTVRLPRNQVFNKQALNSIMQRISAGENL